MRLGQRGGGGLGGAVGGQDSKTGEGRNMGGRRTEEGGEDRRNFPAHLTWLRLLWGSMRVVHPVPALTGP